MPEDTPPARGAGRARGRARGVVRGRGGRGGAVPRATPSADAPTTASNSQPPSTLGTATATGAPSRSVSATPKPTQGTSVGRFRPKVVRRGEAERDDIARQELEKDNAKATAEARAKSRSRGRSQRARGDAMGRGGMMRNMVASGPFSQMTSEGGSRSGGWGGGGGGGGGGFFGGGGGGGGRVKSEGGAFGHSSGYREARINADRLISNGTLDSDFHMTAELLNSKPDDIWPMGIARTDKKEEKKTIATTAELEAEEHGKAEESLWVEGGAWAGSGSAPLVEEETKVWHAAPKGDVQVKSEPGPVDLSIVKSADPEIEKKVTPEPVVKKALADPEVDMIAGDMQLLLKELGNVSIENPEAPETGAAPSSVPDKNARDGRLYLFQFPPLLPPLHPAAAAKVKPEPDDVVMLDQPAGGSVDLTKTEDEVRPKAEGVDKNIDLTDISQLVSQAGMMGKLKVRKSGKVELDWGGRTLDLSVAAGMNFLTKAVIVEESDEKARQGVVGGHGGDSIGMGTIMGRFVLAPTWGDEDEWVVDPEDLVIPDESG